MNTQTKATLLQSKWGRYISLKEIGIELPNKRDMAFLSYGGNCRDFVLGQKYPIKIFFRVVYINVTIKPDGHKDVVWDEIIASTYEGAKDHPNFIKMNLPEFKIVPYFQIIK